MINKYYASNWRLFAVVWTNYLSLYVIVISLNLIHLILIFQYRPDFPNPIKELAVFADLAPRFQLMAEEILQRQIQLVIFNLKQVLLKHKHGIWMKANIFLLELY